MILSYKLVNYEHHFDKYFCYQIILTMVKERVKKIDQVKYAASHNVSLIENDKNSSTDASESNQIVNLKYYNTINTSRP